MLSNFSLNQTPLGGASLLISIASSCEVGFQAFARTPCAQWH